MRRCGRTKLHCFDVDVLGLPVRSVSPWQVLGLRETLTLGAELWCRGSELLRESGL